MVQDILAEQPPAQPNLDANGLEVMCLPFFHTSLALLPLFMCSCRCVLTCPFPAFPCVVFTTPYGVRILLGLLSGMISFINLFVNSWPM